MVMPECRYPRIVHPALRGYLDRKPPEQDAMHPIAAIASRFVPIWSCVLLVSACTAHTLSPLSAKENAAMSQPSADVSAPIDAGQLIWRVLKLIEAVHSAADLTPESIERHTGLRVHVDPADHSRYAASGQVAPDWAYSLASMTYKQGQTPTRLDFDFIDSRPDRDTPADTGAICPLDFEGYRRALVGQGFKPVALAENSRDPGFGYRGAEPWRFIRAGVEVSVRTYGDRDPGAGPACVSGLRISVQE
ncbi:MAG: hypothetical protein ACREP7_18595 [Lysobacter sp.]